MTDRIRREVAKLAEHFESDLESYAGLTLGQLFADLEGVDGARVFWGCWTQAELDTIL